MSHSTWGESKNRAPTTWGANWDYFGAANYVIITLSPSLYCILKVLIITSTSPFQQYQASDQIYKDSLFWNYFDYVVRKLESSSTTSTWIIGHSNLIYAKSLIYLNTATLSNLNSLILNLMFPLVYKLDHI